MVYRGHIERGVVILDEVTALPDGTPVEVRVETQQVGQALEALAGLADLPADVAENHDEYRRTRNGS